MSDLEKLVSLGAYSVGGRLMWKNKVLGTLGEGGFVPTEEGLQALALDVTDVEVKSESPRKGRKPKAEAAPEVQVSADGVIDI